MFKSFLAVAAVALGVVAAPSVQAQNATTAPQALDQQAVEQIVRDYIRQNPEIVIEAIQTYREQQTALQAQQQQHALRAHKSALTEAAGSPVGGNPNGDVTIVEFFDYNCGYCKRVFASLQELVEADKNVRVVFKEFPILGEGSVDLARVSLAAWQADQEKYEDLHARFMNHRGRLSVDRALSIAADAGYDPELLKKLTESAEVREEIERNYAIAQALGINGTPAFVIGDQLVPGAVSVEQLKKMVAAIRGS